MASLVHPNFTLDSPSPMFEYYPLCDGSDASNGWETMEDAETDSTYRFTRTTNASLSLRFFGTGVTLFGTSNASYDVDFDNQRSTQTSSSDNVLFHSDCAELRHYQVILTIRDVTKDQVFRLDNATVTSQVFARSRYPKISDLSSNSESMNVRGTWHDKNNHNRFVSNPNSKVTVRATTSPGDSMSFSVQGRTAAIYGPVNASSGLFSITHGHDVHVLNASSSVPINETLLFYKDGLLENETNTFQLTNLGTGDTVLCISRVQVFAFNSTNATWSTYMNHSSGNQRTAIIGAVVGSILGVAILAVAILVLMRMKTKHKVIDEAGQKAISPFEFGNEETGGAIIRNGSKDSSSLESNPDVSQTSAPPNGTATQPSLQQTSLSTVERLLLLIARQVDSVTRIGEAPGDQDRRSLPPYPASMHNRSFRATT